MIRTRVATICVVLLLAPAAFASALDAQQILSKAKQASGGEAWDSVRSSHVKGTLSTGGMTGTVESWDEVSGGRTLDRFALGPVSGAQGFDGSQVWSQDSSGQVRIEEGGDTREAAANDSYRRSLAFWFPGRWPATIALVGDQREGDRTFHVLRITPKGGRPYDVWVDAVTFLFDRTVEKGALETRTVFLSDYREVGGVKLPFAARSTNGEARYDQLSTVEKVELNPPLEAGMFAIPAPPPPDFSLKEGKTATTVPFELVNNHIYVAVKLDGKGPFRLLCDTGGANIITPELAAALGLKTEGALQGRGVGEKSEDVGLTKVAALEIGDATLHDQVFAVFPLGPFAAVEGIPQSGLIGYEVFKRFVVKVDYEKSLLTLTVPSAYVPSGVGQVVPFKFNNHVPQVEGEIDGIPGRFDIDTGSRASLSLLAPFAEKHGLKVRYGAALEAVTGWGVGGAARGLVTRAKLLKLGNVEVGRPVMELSLQTKGAFIDPYVAGNVGAGVLKRFNITFDYAHQQLVFERNGNDRLPDTYDRAGMWLNLADGAFEVKDVVAGGPAAAAGLKVGDRILAIDGETPAQLTLPEARLKLRNRPTGTEVRLLIATGGVTKEIVLVLKDLV